MMGASSAQILFEYDLCDAVLAGVSYEVIHGRGNTVLVDPVPNAAENNTNMAFRKIYNETTL